MARPCKQGLDYFPLDVHMDRNMQLFEAEFGLNGFAIYIKLLQMIYSEGYFIKWDEDAIILFVKSINSSVNEVNSVINGCIKRELFSNDIFTKHGVLTSRGIQKRYLEACKTSKRKIINMTSEYNLCGNTYDELITELTRLTPEEMPQRKGKKKESIGKEMSPLDLALEDFKKMRNSIKAPMTERAIKLLLSELDKLSDTDEGKIAILEQSIMNNWKGVFQIKQDNRNIARKVADF